MSLEGQYTVLVKTPTGNQEGAFDYKIEGDTLTGTATAMGATVPIADGKVDGDSFSHTMIIKKMTVKVNGAFDGDTIAGEFKIPLGKLKFTGKRI